MKLELSRYDSKTNVGELIPFSISEEKTDQIALMELLRQRLYTDPAKAAVREVLSNALDANIEAGNKHLKVEVSCFENDSDILSIRDYGLGLSPERIQEVYTKFGASTKRDSNRQHGGFGLGAKSIICLSDCSNIVTIHEGIKYVYTFFVNEDRSLHLALMHQEPTEEPSGTRISVSVAKKDRENVSLALKNIAGFGAAPLEILDRRIQKGVNNILKQFHPMPEWNCVINKDIPSVYSGQINVGIRIGHIPYYYPALSNLFEKVRTPSGDGIKIYCITEPHLILTFEIGELELSASRETLIDTPDNRRLLTERLQNAITLNHELWDKLNPQTVKEWAEKFPPMWFMGTRIISKDAPLYEGSSYKSLIKIPNPYNRNPVFDDSGKVLTPSSFIAGNMGIVRILHFRNGIGKEINKLHIREALTKPVYCMETHKALELPEECIVIMFTNFKHKIHSVFNQLWHYPQYYHHALNKPKKEPKTVEVSFEENVKKGLLRRIHVDVLEKTLKNSKNKLSEIAEVIKEIPDESPAFYMELRTDTCYTVECLRAMGKEYIYIATPKLIKSMPEHWVTCQGYAKKLADRLREEFGSIVDYVIHSYLKPQGNARLKRIIKATGVPELIELIDSEVFSDRTVGVLNARYPWTNDYLESAPEVAENIQHLYLKEKNKELQMGPFGFLLDGPPEIKAAYILLKPYFDERPRLPYMLYTTGYALNRATYQLGGDRVEKAEKVFEEFLIQNLALEFKNSP